MTRKPPKKGTDKKPPVKKAAKQPPAVQPSSVPVPSISLPSFLTVKLPSLEEIAKAEKQQRETAMEEAALQTEAPPAPVVETPKKPAEKPPARTGRYSDFSPRVVRLLWSGFALLLLALLVTELFTPSHPAFGIDATPFFFAWYGFLSCACIVLVSNLLGKLLKRPEDYYEGGAS
ncbi:hypothetical protein GC177_02440 [bacterium]|nr:hypothetical protein [bacterium]